MSEVRHLEFTCTGCGTHVVSAIAGDERHRGVCALCANMPGWPDDPRLRELFTRGNPQRRAFLEATREARSAPCP